MKVLHVIPSVAPRYGGPSIAVRAMARQLVAQGAQVTVAAVDTERPATVLGRGEMREVEDGVEYRLLPRTLLGEWKYSRPLARRLAEWIPEHDVLHVHGLFCHTSIPACRIAHRESVPYVLRPLGMLEPWSLRQGAVRKRAYLRLVEATHLRRAAAIHATSAAERDAIIALGYGDHVRVIPLGADLVAGGGHRARGREEGPLHFLFLSRVHPKKGLPLLLGALARMGQAPPGWTLTVAGDGDATHLEEVRRLINRLGIGQSVRFFGHVEGDAKIALFRSADIFVLPSHQENFGLAVAEALGAGIPVVVSPEVGIAEEIRSADAGIVVRREEGALVEALRTLSADSEARQRMGQNAQRLAAQRFSWTAVGERLMGLYEEVTSRPRVEESG